MRTPFGYHRGLRDRPDLLEIVRAAGLRYVTSWGRNEENGNPTPWEVQPFTYDEEGYPDILELPFQFWLDVVWFDQHGYDTGPALLEALKGAVDEVAERDLVYGACFHDWVAIASDERRVGWLRGFFALRAGAGRRGDDLHRLLAARHGCVTRRRSHALRTRSRCVGKCGPWIGSPGAHSSSSSV